MTTAVEIRYLWGRVHATPWGRHTNEGAVEWPPAPRRILRALFAAWKVRRPELDEATVLGLLDALAVPPRYGSPEIRAGFTRHYLAKDEHTSGHSDRMLAIDAFVACPPDQPVIVAWDCELTDAQAQTLATLCAEVPFLGRADALCDIRVSDRSPQSCATQWDPLDPADTADGPIVELLAVTAPIDVAALIQTPAQDRRSKRIMPKASISIPYVSSTAVSAPRSVPMRRAARRPSAIRFLLDGKSLPTVYQSLAVAHLFRQAALRVGPDQSPTLSGKDSHSAHRHDQHRHAHYLVYSSDQQSLDTAVLWAPEGLDNDHVRMLARLNRLTAPHLREVPNLRLLLEGVGDVVSVAPELAGPSRTWRTATPFVITRFPRDGRPVEDHLAEQVATELERRGFPAASVTVENDQGWRRFRRHRPDGRSMQTARPGRQVSLQFGEPVVGPMCLGSLSHFSLGLFMPSSPE